MEDWEEVNTELEMLAATYWDCKIEKTTKNKVPNELELFIELLPLKENAEKEIYAKLDFSIIVHYGYPNVAPTFFLQNPSGLNDSHLEDLSVSLSKLIKEFLGQPCILFELCQCVRKFLSKYNEKPLSCHDEMILMQKKRSKELEMEKQKKLTIEIDEKQKIHMDLKKKKEELKKLKKKDLDKMMSIEMEVTKVNDVVERPAVEINNVFKFPEADELSGSRLKDDFDILEQLGKGGFGDVLKVQNKLDGLYYAIKSIPLNQRNKAVRAKIVREVKLLSRLNHGNVVRYYNSWIETWPEGRVMKNIRSDKVTVDSSKSLFAYSSDEESDFVTFENENNNEDDDKENEEEEKEDEEEEENDDESDDDSDIQKDGSQYLYIQMEYCEKKTLKDVIEDDLYKNEDLIWKLFREIVEGLVHIHEQWIIHRDLKPVNIFMDSNSHVKIGDFGLAISASESFNENKSSNEKNSKSNINCSLTSNIGTVLYISPEIVNSERYNQKVDLYSLGIIMFEMCYKFNTGMERYNVLSRLREPSIIMPDDSDRFLKKPQRAIITWLLNHDPSKRPTAMELLSSEHFPSPPFDKQFFDQNLVSAVKNSSSHAHKVLMQTIFSQTTSTAVDHTYDHYMTKSEILDSKKNLWQLMQEMSQVFERHGAEYMDAPLLLPLPNKIYSDYDNCVKLMNRAGNLVVLSHDTKVGFARFVEKSNTESLKRFFFGKLLKENITSDFHPRESWVASFDIVSSILDDTSIMSDLDVFLVLKDLLEHLQLYERQYELKLNHRDIISAILFYCDIPKDLHNSIFLILNDNKNIDQRKACFMNLGLSEEIFFKFMGFTWKEGTISDINTHLRTITCHSTPESSLIKASLGYMEKLLNLMNFCEKKFKIIVSLNLTTDIHIYSGLFFQFSRCRKRKAEVLAVGGSYNKLIQSFRQLGKISNSNKNAFGMTIYLEKFLSEPILMKSMKRSNVDILLMSYQPNDFQHSLLSFLTSARSLNYRCSIYSKANSTFDQVKNYCKINGILYLVLVDSDLCLYKIEEKEKLVCRQTSTEKLIQYLKRRPRREESSNRKISCNEENNESATTITVNDASPSIDIRLVGFPIPNSQAKKVLNQMQDLLAKFSKNCEIQIIVDDLSKRILKSFAFHIESKDNFTVSSSVNSLFKEFPKDKKYIMKMADEINSLNINKNKILILYSAKDDYYKVIL